MSSLLHKLHNKIFVLFKWSPTNYSPLTETHQFNRFIQALNAFIYFFGMVFMYWLMVFSPMRSLKHILILPSSNLGEKNSQIGCIGRMGQNMNLFFFRKDLTIWDLSAGTCSWKSRMLWISYSGLFLS